jgi:hypothetical protein
MSDEHKDELILALSEMVQELTNKIINLRVEAGLKIKHLSNGHATKEPENAPAKSHHSRSAS